MLTLRSLASEMFGDVAGILTDPAPGVEDREVEPLLFRVGADGQYRLPPPTTATS